MIRSPFDSESSPRCEVNNTYRRKGTHTYSGCQLLYGRGSTVLNKPTLVYLRKESSSRSRQRYVETMIGLRDPGDGERTTHKKVVGHKD